MLVLSPAMEAYEKSLMDTLHIAIAIAKKARRCGLDPSTEVEIPVASDLADRVEALLGINQRCGCADTRARIPDVP